MARVTSSPALPTMAICPICKAEVPTDGLQAHLAWHSSLRAALSGLGLGVNVTGL